MQLSHLLIATSIALLGMSEACAARHALLIGNDEYQAIGKLKNAGRDADAMATALRSAKYEVTLVKNRNLRQMKADLRQFKGKVQSGDEVVLFYAGHGVQIGASNYILPVDLQSDSEAQVKDESIALSKILEDLREAQPALVLAIIDACRDNPFKGQGRTIGGRGLAGVNGATGQMVIYSAGEGQQALDRLGDNDPVRNGVFTRVFVKEMAKRGVSIDQMARNVREEVNQMARSRNHEQVPAIFDQVLGQFYFYAPSGDNATVQPKPAAPSIDAGPALELNYWQSVRDSNSGAELLAYLTRYPSGQFAELAIVRLLALPTADAAAKLQVMRAAAEQGNVKAMLRLGRWYENGHNCKVDRLQALQWYQRAADAGNPDGLAGVAAFALNGWEGPKDRVKALALAQKAASAGSARALLTLSVLYREGSGGAEKNDAMAAEFLRQSAGLGHKRAAYTLAMYNAFWTNSSIVHDKELALRMLRLALEANEDGDEKGIAAETTAAMGDFYRTGFWDLPKDEEKAREWLNRSVALGSSMGMVSLGMMLYGPQTAAGLEKSRDLFTKAAAQGHPKAMLLLGTFHEYGLGGTPIDRYQARQWYQRALEAGSPEARAKIDALK